MQLLGRIMEGGVLEAFLDRGARFAPVLRDIPLIVVTNDMLGLLGARQYALKLLDENITEVRSSPDCS
jgi:glucokinase